MEIQCSMDSDILILRNVLAGSTPHYSLYGFEHLGTWLFNQMLLDIHYRQDIEIRSIKGRLSCADCVNGNWKKSIPFYRDFPQYLSDKLPYKLSFSIYDNNSLLVIDETENLMRTCKNTDLYFTYEVNYTG